MPSDAVRCCLLLLLALASGPPAYGAAEEEACLLGWAGEDCDVCATGFMLAGEACSAAGVKLPPLAVERIRSESPGLWARASLGRVLDTLPEGSTTPLLAVLAAEMEPLEMAAALGWSRGETDTGFRGFT